MNEPDWTTHVTAGAAWRRFGLMVVYVPILACVGLFIAFTALFQFFSVLSQGEPNPQLGRNGRDLARYAADIIDFLTYNSEKRPFPFAVEGDSAPPGETRPSEPAAPRKTPTTRKKTGTARKKTTTRRTTARKKTSTKQTTETRVAEAPPEQPDADKPSE